MTQEKLFIKNRYGKKLSAVLFTPEKPTKKIIIVTHGFKGHKNYQPIQIEFYKKAEFKGYAVLGFDCYGSGESEGDFTEASITTEKEDLKDMIKFAREKGYPDICLIGTSLGVTLSILAYDEQIKCMVFWNPVFEHNHKYQEYKDDVLKQGFIIRKQELTGNPIKIGKPMWESFGKTDTFEDLKKVKCPVLGIMGSEDDHQGIDKLTKYMNEIRAEHKLEIIDGTGHIFLDKFVEPVISLTMAWVKKHL